MSKMLMFSSISQVSTTKIFDEIQGNAFSYITINDDIYVNA